ncbi:MAG: allantoicase [Vicinamibacteria bacterium]|nr:allantoicase [Vicinamibacteria bacterium]
MTEDFTTLVDLASARLGGRVLFANDEFFASRHNLVRREAPIFIADKFTPNGKWMDGWESRRKRGPGHDWCVIELGRRGIVQGVDIDTAFFTGNFPEKASIDTCDVAAMVSRRTMDRLPWSSILSPVALAGNTHNLFAISIKRPVTHLRFHIYPDGGVARLRVYGDVAVDWKKKKGIADLAAMENGGRALLASDEHFGLKNNLLLPGRAPNMGEGWESRRRRGPGHDWVIIRLGAPGHIEKVEIDTNHFKGNYPEIARLDGAFAPDAAVQDFVDNRVAFKPLLAEHKLRPHRRHLISRGIEKHETFTHVRMRIFPDGGVSRLRLYGRPRLA